ncbi:guanine nucleotide exchange factor DBS [Carlito syrichta]|uniref:Guanine nucleotide exchange factor DBS n=1 Tax=Carlito syrichta TaxID=1868482 RepID=A0A3Q0DGY5_CARSF|nr:guanine nucleotide exchange factor DBS [Carlito syrichta]
MHQDIIPLCAADIQDQLKKRFAYLSGGRGQDGSPVITFPDYPAFSEIPDKEFQNVMTYLTSIPSLQDAGIGFILVIDRRRDRWTSVKASVLRSAASFPANLQLVLVLRPAGFFQRTLSDIAFKFNRDDFKMKVPVIMLSSVPELHGYIDKSQLTEDLGGTLDYCHSRWLCHRTAIESFAIMVKRTAQMLQSFGTELAETELPNDVPSTRSVLCAHTEKKERAKEDMRLALREGQSILERIGAPPAEGAEHGVNQDQLDNQATMQRLLSQLNETEAAFDEFWAKHQQKLEQCLQLRHFEQGFREVKAALDTVSQKMAAFTDVGNSLAHVEHLLRDLANFEEKSSAAVGRAQALCGDGERLIEDKHYAVDSIRPKCEELRHLCDHFSAEVARRRGLLGKSLELHSLLETSMRWCDEGIYLLASQPVDKCQSQDGAEAALQEIEKFLETGAESKIQELSRLCKEYESILSQDLMEHVRKVFQKQEGVEEMFHRRQASLKKLAAKQTRPVQPVAPRPEALSKSPCPSPGIRRGSENTSVEGSGLRRGPCRRAKSEVSETRQGRGSSAGEEEESLAILRRHVMNELLDTERAYVEELLCVLEGYAAEMDNPLMSHLISTGLHSKKDVLFGNMEEIYHFHNRIFLRELEGYIDCPELVGRCFLERMEDFQIYEKYCQNKPRSESLWRQCSDCPFFQECQRKLDHKLSLDSYLLKPVQRITKYQLLLKGRLCPFVLHTQPSCGGLNWELPATNLLFADPPAFTAGDNCRCVPLAGGSLSASHNATRLLRWGHMLLDQVHSPTVRAVLGLDKSVVARATVTVSREKGHCRGVLRPLRTPPGQPPVSWLQAHPFRNALGRSPAGGLFTGGCPTRRPTRPTCLPVAAQGNLGALGKLLMQGSFSVWTEHKRGHTKVKELARFKPMQRHLFLHEKAVLFCKRREENGEGYEKAPSYSYKQSLNMAAVGITESVKGDARKFEIWCNAREEVYIVQAPTPEIKAAWVSEIRKVLTGQLQAYREASQHRALEQSQSLPLPASSSTSPSRGNARNAKKLEERKTDPLSLEGYVGSTPPPKPPEKGKGWSKTSHSLEAPEDDGGWSSAEEPVNSSDAEEDGGPGPRTLAPGRCTVVADVEKGGPDTLAVRSGDELELLREGQEGLW